MLTITFFLCIIGVVIAQIPGLGVCPDLDTIPTFDVDKYVGKWYEQYRYFNTFELGGKCVTADYSLNDDGTIKVVNSKVCSFTGYSSSIEGSARIVDPEDPGKLAVSFSVSPIEGSYWILDTDYDSYSAVWSCQSVLLAKLQFAWILTRDQNASDAVIEKALDAFKKYNISTSLLQKTDQVNC